MQPAIRVNGSDVMTLWSFLKNNYQSQGQEDMSDTFIKGLQRALARKKVLGAAGAVKPTARPVVAVKPFAKFDELVYRAMVVTKMIKLIQKYKEQKQ
ncbi:MULTISPECIES: hypothetical protein [unclassified Pseudomonas]|uniref:hypothetical protein n=1 Tax=unclassified Pseudomonas TaxID=196821 RepID=UPI00224B42AA|nr:MULTISPECIES: hypothetical protein [unclassified Pseudomonas]MCX2814569.1 hypothetical protein [Pseudomonas sp. DCB_E]MCX9143950.1 hypothetical protein [Pseudomonas sp. DCB_Q]